MEKDLTELTHTKKNMASYGFGKFTWEFHNMVFGAFVFFFYESELGLASWLTMLGYIIFAVWNAVNDPLIGYLIDRPFKFTKKWGRRFPFILFGGIPWILSYILIFTPPSYNAQADMLLLFLWIVFTTCLYDFFSSIYNVSFYAVFPDKFRSEEERRMANMISTLIAALGVALGSIIPPLFITWGDLRSYIVSAGVVVIITLIAFFLAIPGAREDQERVDCYIDKCEEGVERQSFFKEMKTCIKHRNFFAFSVAYLFYRSLVSMMIGSVPYFVQFVLGLEATAVTILMAFLLVGMFISMPLWMKIAEKLNDNRKAIIYASFFLSISAYPLFFIRDYYISMIAILIFGIGEGGFWTMMNLVLANIIDESVVQTGQRKEATYNGFQVFLGRFALVVQALSFGIVHMLTGFVEGASSQNPWAIIGIQFHFSALPAIYMLIASVIIWRYYDLSSDKYMKYKEQIIKAGL